MFLTDSLEDANKVRKWSTQSREAAPWYQHEEIGYNYRMSNIIAGIIRGQIPFLSEHIDQKRAIYERYRDGLKDLPVKMNPYDVEKSVPNFWLSCLIIDEDATIEGNGRGRTNAYIKGSGIDVGADIFRRGLCLPSDNKMTPEQQDVIIEIIRPFENKIWLSSPNNTWDGTALS